MKICHDYALTAIETLARQPRKNGPLRFVYISGYFAPRNRSEITKPVDDHGLVNLAYFPYVMLDDEALGPGHWNSSLAALAVGINGLRTRGD
ncbi:hypothetical protein F4677DRAFT_441578 [Hypoxylon crocopeplum]|nr:hypothetical protein F4677DRAFT_441578 [Hypoxylon crocopeplum]